MNRWLLYARLLSPWPAPTIAAIPSAHISAPAVTGSRIPATLSSILLTDKLRKELGYRHLIVTDAMEMGAISQYYPDADATVASILAGVDLVVCPKDFTGSFEAVLAAVERGTIREERLDESVGRVLELRRELRGCVSAHRRDAAAHCPEAGAAE